MIFFGAAIAPCNAVGALMGVEIWFLTSDRRADRKLRGGLIFSLERYMVSNKKK